MFRATLPGGCIAPPAINGEVASSPCVPGTNVSSNVAGDWVAHRPFHTKVVSSPCVPGAIVSSNVAPTWVAPSPSCVALVSCLCGPRTVVSTMLPATESLLSPFLRRFLGPACVPGLLFRAMFPVTGSLFPSFPSCLSPVCSRGHCSSTVAFFQCVEESAEFRAVFWRRVGRRPEKSAASKKRRLGGAVYFQAVPSWRLVRVASFEWKFVGGGRCVFSWMYARAPLVAANRAAASGTI